MLQYVYILCYADVFPLSFPFFNKKEPLGSGPAPEDKSRSLQWRSIGAGQGLEKIFFVFLLYLSV